jgi:hypothetical protein
VKPYVGPVALVVSSAALLAVSAERLIAPACSGTLEFAGNPAVPTKEAAREIYIRTDGTWTVDKYPIIHVEDLGNRWRVTQSSSDPEALQQLDGGGASLDINKCTGAISNKVYGGG